MNEQRSTPGNDGPVFNGDVSHSQFAWGNETVTQNQQNDNTVAPGYEALAERVNELLRQLPRAGLAEQDRQDTQDAAEGVLAEITRVEPVEETRLRRALATLRGALAPVATGVVAGTTVGAQEWALAAITGLTGV
ncbi:hypothetical protein OG259_28025 [Streptomyces sp. NBC_00250]|uniref:hypothetical protein n=1 Tax=Streptomyces sp. NBC_00250 TaxID=2903641 RepID=UPI002E298322|nr:hypothetical protein [Streptomyces sp. NBC_00250]